jgi:hypothetical protein
MKKRKILKDNIFGNPKEFRTLPAITDWLNKTDVKKHNYFFSLICTFLERLRCILKCDMPEKYKDYFLTLLEHEYKSIIYSFKDDPEFYYIDHISNFIDTKIKLNSIVRIRNIERCKKRLERQKKYQIIS